LTIGQAFVIGLIGSTLTGVALLVGIIANIARERKESAWVLALYVGLLLGSLFVLSLNLGKVVNIHALALNWCIFQAVAITATVLLLIVNPFELAKRHKNIVINIPLPRRSVLRVPVVILMIIILSPLLALLAAILMLIIDRTKIEPQMQRFFNSEGSRSASIICHPRTVFWLAICLAVIYVIYCGGVALHLIATTGFS
jgi:hypothetical protein